jgi:hypothetical protein
MPIDSVKNILQSMRKHNRIAVLLPALVETGDDDFYCTAYDLSLSGIRLKIDCALENNTEVLVHVKNKLKKTAKVVWSEGGFVGLNFCEDPFKIKAELGNLASTLH